MKHFGFNFVDPYDLSCWTFTLYIGHWYSSLSSLLCQVKMFDLGLCCCPFEKILLTVEFDCDGSSWLSFDWLLWTVLPKRAHFQSYHYKWHLQWIDIYFWVLDRHVVTKSRCEPPSDPMWILRSTQTNLINSIISIIRLNDCL